VQPNVSPTSTVLSLDPQIEYSSQVVDISHSGTVIQVHDPNKVSNESYRNKVACGKLASSSVKLADVSFKPSEPAYFEMPTSDVLSTHADFAHSQLLNSDMSLQLSDHMHVQPLYPDVSLQPSESIQFNKLNSDVSLQPSELIQSQSQIIDEFSEPSNQVNRIMLTGSKKVKDKMAKPLASDKNVKKF